MAYGQNFSSLVLAYISSVPDTGASFTPSIYQAFSRYRIKKADGFDVCFTNPLPYDFAGSYFTVFVAKR